MKKIIKIEFVKIASYNVFRVLILLHFVLFFLVVLVTSQLDITVPGFSTSNLYQFPNVWEFFPWVASWFNILLAILIIVLTGNEYSYHTFRQHVIDGLSRIQLLTGKASVIVIIAIYSTLMVFLFSVVFGFMFTRDYTFSVFYEKTYVLLVYFLQAIAYMALGFFIAILFKNTGLSITLFILFRFIIEPVIRLFFPKQFRLYFPVKVISNLTPMPEFLTIFSGKVNGDDTAVDTYSLREMGIVPEELPVLANITLTVGYTILFIFLAWLILRRRNL
jgi:ABC-2 type transport system permease protein